MSASHGLTEKTVETINHVLIRFPEVEKALLFGSRAKGTYRAGSDIDLTLQGDRLTQKIVDQIDEELDDLPLPYRFSLSLFSNITDAEFLAHIQRVGTVFYERTRLIST